MVAVSGRWFLSVFVERVSGAHIGDVCVLMESDTFHIGVEFGCRKSVECDCGTNVSSLPGTQNVCDPLPTLYFYFIFLKEKSLHLDLNLEKL